MCILKALNYVMARIEKENPASKENNLSQFTNIQTWGFHSIERYFERNSWADRLFSIKGKYELSFKNF